MRNNIIITHPATVFSHSADLRGTGSVVVNSVLSEQMRTSALLEYPWMKNVWHEAAVISDSVCKGYIYHEKLRYEVWTATSKSTGTVAVLTRFLPLPIPVPWPAGTLSLVSEGLEGLRNGLKDTWSDVPLDFLSHPIAKGWFEATQKQTDAMKTMWYARSWIVDTIGPGGPLPPAAADVIRHVERRYPWMTSVRLRQEISVEIVRSVWSSKVPFHLILVQFGSTGIQPEAVNAICSILHSQTPCSFGTGSA
jgi:hypothetical protein